MCHGAPFAKAVFIEAVTLHRPAMGQVVNCSLAVVDEGDKRVAEATLPYQRPHHPHRLRSIAVASDQLEETFVQFGARDRQRLASGSHPD